MDDLIKLLLDKGSISNSISQQSKFTLFIKNYKSLSNKEKIKILKQYSLSDMFILLKKVHDSPLAYESEIEQSVYKCIINKLTTPSNEEKIKMINKLIKEIQKEDIRVKAVGKYLELEDIEFVELSERVIS